jgi:hypothetical protein
MNEIREELLKVYSQSPVKEVIEEPGIILKRIHDSDEYQALLKKYQGEVFNWERDTMQEAREVIDEQLAPNPEGSKSAKQKVEMALRLFRRSEVPEKKEVWRALILVTYAKDWSEPQQKYFTEVSLRLINAVNYFLSFTNRNPALPNMNLINRTHKYFIMDAIGRKEYGRADLSTKNMLAETVQYYLKNTDLSGFYYPEHFGNNAIVEDKLKENCLSALAFVQLVQSAMFRYDAATPNWCFKEYGWANNVGTEHILFVQIEKTISNNALAPRFGGWYAALQAKDPLRLQESRWQGRQPIDENVNALTDGPTSLVSQIRRAENKIYTDIPD